MLAEDIVNRSLDAVGCSDQAIADMQSGTMAARVALRHYIPCLEMLLRGAYWNFARKTAPMQLLGAVPGYGPSVPSGQTAPYGAYVIPPWTFEYAWPIDCVAVRFVPWNNDQSQWNAPSSNYSLPAGPQTTFSQPFPSTSGRIVPAPMLVATDTNYPLASGWTTPASAWWNTRGQAIDMQTVILTDVPCAELVYTAFIPYPNLWDPLFQEAMCALLATYLALPLSRDKKEGRVLRGEQVALAKAAIGQARIRDGSEGWNSVERTAEWISGRNAGASYGWGWGAPGVGNYGVLGYGWSGVGMGDGSVY